MFIERVARHYQAAGWVVQVPESTEATPDHARPDLRIRKGKMERWVLVREEPPGPFELARFGQTLRQAKVQGIVVCPEDARVQHLCEQAGLDFVAGETIGDTVVVGEAAAPVPIQTPPPPRPAEPAMPVAVPAPEELRQPEFHSGPVRWWRWGIVAVIWALALGVLWFDVQKARGG